MNLKDYLSITPEVSAALRDGKPVLLPTEHNRYQIAP